MSKTQSREHAADVLNGQTVTQNGIVHTYTGFNKSMIACQKYTCKNCSEFHKFYLRDDYFAEKMENNIYYISRDVNKDVHDLQDIAVIETYSVIYCKFCFNYISNELARPLNWRQFELLLSGFGSQLELQIILTNTFVH